MSADPNHRHDHFCHPVMRVTDEDRRMMAECIALARRGAGRVSPNPMVGCVITSAGAIIARGWHHRFGAVHAEVDALRRARRSVMGATMYVNLEPCNHTGKTPPCTEAIIKAGIARVVIGSRDANPAVRGGGVRRLRAAGIDVVTGVLERECGEANRFFCYAVQHRTPYVTVKMAQSLDGMIARRRGARTTISGSIAQRHVHALRATYDAVLVGAGTMRIDAPRLTVRAVAGRNPLRVILDTRLSATYGRAFLRSDAQTLIYCADAASRARKAITLRKHDNIGIVAVPLDRGMLNMRSVLRDLHRRGITSVLVEGGATVASHLLSRRLVNELQLIIAPAFFGEGVPAFTQTDMHRRDIASLRAEPLGRDLLLVARFTNTHP